MNREHALRRQFLTGVLFLFWAVCLLKPEAQAQYYPIYSVAPSNYPSQNYYPYQDYSYQYLLYVIPQATQPYRGYSYMPANSSSNPVISVNPGSSWLTGFSAPEINRLSSPTLTNNSYYFPQGSYSTNSNSYYLSDKYNKNISTSSNNLNFHSLPYYSQLDLSLTSRNNFPSLDYTKIYSRYGESLTLGYYSQTETYYKIPTTEVTNTYYHDAGNISLVRAEANLGMYCWEPAKWIKAGTEAGIWGAKISIRAQVFNKHGRKIVSTPTFLVWQTGESGSMSLYRSDLLLYQGMILANAPADYISTVTAGYISDSAINHRKNAGCDTCHPTPPGHTANPDTWGHCHDCHRLPDKIHRHAFVKASIPIDKCYTCHPVGCLSGVHGESGLWCTDCHGSLAEAVNGGMKIGGQLGKPYCGDCHDAIHSEKGQGLFQDSAGHGGVWCLNCHGPTHVEKATPFGYNDCQVCHTVQANLTYMGPDCQECHTSSVSPHLVTPVE